MDPSKPSRRQVLAGGRALLVDDAADALDFFTFSLVRADAEVKAVSSAAEALEELQHALPDVLVSDIRLPGSTGYDLIRQVRARPAAAGGSIPALAVTAFGRPEEQAIAREMARYRCAPIY